MHILDLFLYKNFYYGGAVSSEPSMPAVPKTQPWHDQTKQATFPRLRGLWMVKEVIKENAYCGGTLLKRNGCLFLYAGRNPQRHCFS